MAHSPSILPVTISDRANLLFEYGFSLQMLKMLYLQYLWIWNFCIVFSPSIIFSHTIHNGHSKSPDSRSESLDLLQMWSFRCMYWSVLLLQKSLEVAMFPSMFGVRITCKAVFLHSFHHICVANTGIHLTSASATQMDFISSCGQRPGRPNGGICCKGTSLCLVHRDLVSLKFQIDLRSGMHKFSNTVVATLKFWVTEMWRSKFLKWGSANIRCHCTKLTWQPEFVQLCLRLA